MPNPTRAEQHIDTPLTNVSLAYVQDQNRFIADQVFPRVPVTKQSNKYFTYDIGDWWRSNAERRAPGTPSAGGGWRQSTDSYFCERWALHHPITPEDRANADPPQDPDADAAEWLTQQMLLAREIDWAANFFTTSVWTGSTTGSDLTAANLWSTVAGTPIQDVTDQATSISNKTGYDPNILILGRDVFDSLKNHEDLIDRVKYTQRGSITVELLSGLFEVEKVLVAKATRNTAAEKATDSLSLILDTNDALLLYAAPAPGIKRPSAGYTFVWNTPDLGANAYGQAVSKWYNQDINADKIEVNAAWDHKVVAANCGAFWNEVTS